MYTGCPKIMGFFLTELMGFFRPEINGFFPESRFVRNNGFFCSPELMGFFFMAPDWRTTAVQCTVQLYSIHCTPLYSCTGVYRSHYPKRRTAASLAFASLHAGVQLYTWSNLSMCSVHLYSWKSVYRRGRRFHFSSRLSDYTGVYTCTAVQYSTLYTAVHCSVQYFRFTFVLFPACFWFTSVYFWFTFGSLPAHYWLTSGLLPAYLGFTFRDFLNSGRLNGVRFTSTTVSWRDSRHITTVWW